MPDLSAIEAYGSNICATSSLPLRRASRFSAMVRLTTRSSRSGSMPFWRRSCCRHSHGVGTSETVANLSRTRSESRNVCRWHGRIYEIDVHALTGIETERLRGIEWRIEYCAKILADLDVHGGGDSGLGWS